MFILSHIFFKVAFSFKAKDKDKNKDLNSKDKQGLINWSSRTRTYLEDNNNVTK